MFTTRKELWFNVQDAIFFGKVNWFSKSHIIFFSILLKFTHCSLSIRNPLLFSLLSSHSSYLLTPIFSLLLSSLQNKKMMNYRDKFSSRPNCGCLQTTNIQSRGENWIEFSIATQSGIDSRDSAISVNSLSLYIYGTLTPSHKSGKKWGKVSGPYAVCRSACIMYTYVTCNIIL